MVRLPWAKGNLLIAFTTNDIIKELGLHMCQASLCLPLSETHTAKQWRRKRKIANETRERDELTQLVEEIGVEEAEIEWKGEEVRGKEYEAEMPSFYQ